jgi:hypothetical protein
MSQRRNIFLWFRAFTFLLVIVLFAGSSLGWAFSTSKSIYIDSTFTPPTCKKIDLRVRLNSGILQLEWTGSNEKTPSIFNASIDGPQNGYNAAFELYSCRSELWKARYIDLLVVQAVNFDFGSEYVVDFNLKNLTGILLLALVPIGFLLIRMALRRAQRHCRGFAVVSPASKLKRPV